jgi:hypothetical protein
VFLTIELPDARDVKLNLKPEGQFIFSAKGPADDTPYELDLELFDAVNVEVSAIDGISPLFRYNLLHSNSIFCRFFAGEQGSCCGKVHMLSYQESREQVVA